MRGRALTEHGDGVPDASVFLIPKGGGPAIASRTDQTGSYEFTAGVPPGDYGVAALTGLYEPERADPDVMTRFRVRGTDLTIGVRTVGQP
jgi:hypothetical protein